MVILLVIIFAVVVVEVIRLYLQVKGNSKLARALIKRKNELSYLVYITNSALTDNDPINVSFTRHLRVLLDTVHWTYHSIFRLYDKQQVVLIRFVADFPDWYIEEFSKKVHVRVGDACVGRAVATKQPAIINSAAVDPRFSNVTMILKPAGYRSLTCCPIIGKTKVYGGFCTYYVYENAFTTHDSQFLITCANFFGAILEAKLLKQYVDTNGNPPLPTDQAVVNDL